jgi:excisionase family DNA binding protein
MSATKTKKQAPPKSEVLTLAEAAAYLRVTERALSEMADSAVVPGRKIGGDWRFLKTALEDWLCHGSTNGTTKADRVLDLLLDLSSEESEASRQERKKRILAQAGIWKDDPTLAVLLRKIARERGQPVEA